jgi:hypothetical protein
MAFWADGSDMSLRPYRAGIVYIIHLLLLK